MFSSSTNNPISLPHPSPSFIPHTFSFAPNHPHDLDLLHHYFNLGHQPITSSTPNNMMLFSSPKGVEMNREVHRPNDQDISFPRGLNNNKPKRKQIQKKDRHCKIVTARGPRDRRVRLSMDIARQFFDLQDLLGFDKASKTLDWLLTESNTSIKELVQMKQIEEHNTKHIHSSSECKGYGNVGSSKSTFIMRNGEEIFSEKSAGIGFDSGAKELRAKARARARERTVEKKCKKKQVFDVKTCACELFCFCQPSGEEYSEETFENSGVITKKMKPSTVDNLEMKSCTLTFSNLPVQYEYFKRSA